MLAFFPAKLKCCRYSLWMLPLQVFVPHANMLGQQGSGFRIAMHEEVG
jgi:hypothetical protein